MGGSFWMFGAKMTETNGNKLFFLGIQRQRLAPKVRPWEAGFGPELRLAPKVRPWEARFGCSGPR